MAIERRHVYVFHFSLLLHHLFSLHQNDRAIILNGQIVVNGDDLKAKYLLRLSLDHSKITLTVFQIFLHPYKEDSHAKTVGKTKYVTDRPTDRPTN